MVNKFWMVLGRDVPRKQHTSELFARQEAVRLARLHPGESFTVLASLTTVKMNDLTWEDHSDENSTALSMKYLFNLKPLDF